MPHYFLQILRKYKLYLSPHNLKQKGRKMTSFEKKWEEAIKRAKAFYSLGGQEALQRVEVEVKSMTKPFPEGIFANATSWSEAGGEEISRYNDALEELTVKLAKLREDYE